MPRYFKPAEPKSGRNYNVTRRMKNGLLTRDQLPFEGIYTPHEMAQIVDAERIPGEWIDVPRSRVVFIFGLRQQVIK